MSASRPSRLVTGIGAKERVSQATWGYCQTHRISPLYIPVRLVHGPGDDDAPQDAPRGVPAGGTDRAPSWRLASSRSRSRLLHARVARAHRPRAGTGQVRQPVLRRHPRAVRSLRRQLRHHPALRRPDGAARSDPAAVDHVARDQPHRSRRHAVVHLLPALSPGALARHARSAERRAGGVERGGIARPSGGAEFRPDRTAGARRALRLCRRGGGGGVQAVGKLGRGRAGARQAARRVRRSRQGALRQLPGTMDQHARSADRAALAAGPAGDHAGRIVAARA